MPEKISIVIPMIHEYPQVYGTVNHIQTEMQDSPYNWEVILAENGTIDPNTERMKGLYRINFRQGVMKYVFEPRQCGPIARNSGTRIADGEYVVFMDAHTSLGKGSLGILADYLHDHKDVGSVAGLTSWSHYDLPRMGAYYELFHPEEKQQNLQGGPTLPTHMHGHYMPLGRVRDKAIIAKLKPFLAVMGSQAYTMYRRKEFLELGGYFEGCRFYPHPEGYMPLKVWMTGQKVAIHPGSYHIHGMYPRSYKMSNQQKMLDSINGILTNDVLDLHEKIEEIKLAMMYDQPDEGEEKIKEYGGWSWSEHGVGNVFKIAYILGGDKWLDLCYGVMIRKHGVRRLPQMKKLAVEVVEESGEKDRLERMSEMTLDEVLTIARKQRIPGMENWFSKIGPDPLGE